MDPCCEIKEFGHGVDIEAGEDGRDDGYTDLCCGTIV
jgi:hypothetical protein